MRRIGSLFAFILLFPLLQIASPAQAENRVALVVGNASYRNVPSLANSASDARLMASTLRALGFRLVGDAAQIDLDKAGFDSAVRAFGDQLQGADVGLFYYAGHGLQVRGINYLVPVGANPVREADVDFELEDVTRVLRQMEAAGTRLNLVMLDACRNNPFGGRGLRAIDSGLAQMRAPQGTLISFATQPGNIAQDGNDGHSPYSRALVQTIVRPGLGVFDAMNQVGLTVTRATGGEQQPWVSSSPIDGAFYFAGTPKAEDLRPAPPAVSEGAPLPRPAPAAPPPPRAEAPSPPPPAQDEATKAQKDPKTTQVALVSPVQTAPQVPSEQRDKADRGVAIYNGKWFAKLSGSCPHTSSGTIYFNNGNITGDVFGSEGTGRVTADGAVTGSFEVIGLFRGSITGKMTSATYGSGTWRNNGCTGGWTLTR